LNALTIFCFAVLLIQITYFLFFLYAFSKKVVKKPVPAVPVSVIVCAQDEEQNLRELVPLLLAQSHLEFEIIIVEDRSNDNSFEYLLEESKKNPMLKVVRVDHKPDHVNGKKYGLTLGIRAAKFEWVLFTDADCRPSSNHWISDMVQEADSNTQFVLGFSAYKKLPGFLNLFIRFETLLTGIQYIAYAIIGKPYMGVGRNLAYRKSLFLSAKGFYPFMDTMGGDDDLFVNQHATGINTKISIGQESLVISAPQQSWHDFYIQKLRHLSVGKYYKFSNKVWLGLFSLTWILTSLVVLPAMYFTPFFYPIIVILGVRWLIMIGVFHQASKKLKDPIEAWKVPALDIIYAFYYLVTGLVAFASKNVRWKKS
jgi:glycosyltransferase involved in cell wall biosynthesis